MPQLIVATLFPALVGTVGGNILTGIIGIGLSIASSLLAQLFAPKPPKPEDLQGIIRQSVNIRQKHYGIVRVGGPLAFIETKSGTLYQIVVHSQGPIDGYEDDVYIDQRYVELDGTGINAWSGGVVTPPYDVNTQKITSYLGATSQTADATLVTEFPTIWSVDHKLNGLAYSVFKTGSVGVEAANKVYPNRIPALNRVIRGAKVYDPRTETTVFAETIPLFIRDYLTSPDGMQLPDDLMDDDMFSDGADIADEDVDTKAGPTIKRYNGALSYSFEAEPKDILARALTACDGRLVLTSQGKIGVQIGWVEPTVTFDDTAGQIISANFRDGSGPFTESNEVIIKYTNVNVGFKEATSDPWRDEASITDTGEVRSTMVAAYEIKHHNHARRIAKLIQRRLSPRWQGTVTTTLHGLNAWDERWVNIVYPDLDIDGTFEIINTPTLNVDEMTLTYEVASFDADAYDFDPEAEEGDAPAIPEELPDEEIPAPTSVVTGSESREIGTVTNTVYDPETDENTDNETTIQVYVATIAWAAAPWAGLQGEAQYSLNGFDWFGMPVAIDALKAETGGMSTGSVVKLRVRFRALGGGVSTWVNGSDVTIP